jgi:hypothetical protein
VRALIVVLLVVGFVVTYWWWIAVVLGAVVTFLGILSSHLARREDARREKQAALVARADQQHALVLAGDDRDIYGNYPPKQIAIDAGSIPVSRTSVYAVQIICLD